MRLTLYINWKVINSTESTDLSSSGSRYNLSNIYTQHTHKQVGQWGEASTMPSSQCFYFPKWHRSSYHNKQKARLWSKHAHSKIPGARAFFWHCARSSLTSCSQSGKGVGWRTFLYQDWSLREWVPPPNGATKLLIQPHSLKTLH